MALSFEKTLSYRQFESLFECYHKDVYCFILAHFLDSEVAENLTADVFVFLYRHLLPNTLNCPNLSVFLYAISLYAINTFLKEHHSHPACKNCNNRLFADKIGHSFLRHLKFSETDIWQIFAVADKMRETKISI